MNRPDIIVVDARGLMCPLPLLRLKKALMDAPESGLLAVLATDPAAKIDLGVYMEQVSHELLSMEENSEGVLEVLIRKISAPSA